MKILPTVTQFKDIAKSRKQSGEFEKLGHAQNALAKEYGYKDFNAIRPYLKEEIKYNQFHNGVYRISDRLIIDKYGLLLLNKDGEAIKRAIEPIEQEDIDKTKLFVKLLQPAKNITSKISSYSLKHRAENYLREHTEYENRRGDAYVGNGVLIVTMLVCGFKMKPSSEYPEMEGYEYSQNAHFNVYVKQIEEIMDIDSAVRR